MSFKITYRPLFHLNLYHHYFLDNGTIAFDSDTTLKQTQLEKYQLNEFMRIVPSERTQHLLNNQKVHLKHRSHGISLFAKAKETAPDSGIFEPFIELLQSETMVFLLYTTDPLFENYSTIKATPSIPFYFSNRKPASEANSFPTIDIESTTTAIPDFTISEITFEAVSEGLSASEKIGLLGIISLQIQADEGSRNILNGNNTLKVVPTEFKIQLKNRSTIWNYINATSNSLLHSTDPTTLPLVKNGIVGYTDNGTELPAASPKRLIFEKDGGGTIIKIISEIYIN